MKKLLLVLLSIFSFFELVSADIGDYGCFSMMGGSFGYVWMFFIGIVWILVIVALALFIIWLIRQLIEEPRRKR
ncbi:MAG: hypothetical protein ABIH72_03970 [archaeon]